MTLEKDPTTRRQGVLHIDDVNLKELAAQHGTPLYVYAREVYRSRARLLQKELADTPHLICYAVKANSNLNILRDFGELGLGADVVSLGELRRAEQAGIPHSRMVYSGVGKTKIELAAAIAVPLRAINIESIFEWEQLEALAREQGRSADVCLRINPDIAAYTQDKIATGHHGAKFGLTLEAAEDLARRKSPLRLKGISCHIGSQLTDLSPIEAAGRVAIDFVKRLRAGGHDLSILDMGGGLGVRYQDETPPSVAAYAQVMKRLQRECGLTLVLEPGRWLVAPAGFLLTQVIGVKETSHKKFVVVDGGMNDLIRPAFYDAFHEIVSVEAPAASEHVYDVVGPICESGDILAPARKLPVQREGNLLCLKTCGAYGMSMASQYNSRPRAAEVLVNGKEVRVIRRRESLADLWRHEEN